MADAFALFDEPRQPWLDVEALKGKFLTQSSETHPDKFTDPAEKESAQEGFTKLNTAHDILRDPKGRLQHLLTLERGEKPAEVHDILPETADLFIEVGQLLKPVDECLDDREKQTSTLLKAQSYPEALDWLEKVNSLQQTIAQHLQQLDTQAQSLNSNWDCDSIEKLFHQYSYLQKWQMQLNDRAVRLGL
jgi:curved DNA-binding protein CbpA